MRLGSQGGLTDSSADPSRWRKGSNNATCHILRRDKNRVREDRRGTSSRNRRWLSGRPSLLYPAGERAGPSLHRLQLRPPWPRPERRHPAVCGRARTRRPRSADRRRPRTGPRVRTLRRLCLCATRGGGRPKHREARARRPAIQTPRRQRRGGPDTTSQRGGHRSGVSRPRRSPRKRGVFRGCRPKQSTRCSTLQPAR